jgi:hypothetical protein
MMGDRADVIFADPSDISGFIVNKCWVFHRKEEDMRQSCAGSPSINA